MSILNTISRSLKTNSPSILTGIGVAGVIGTAILAAKATPKAMEARDQEVLQAKEEIVPGGDLDTSAGERLFRTYKEDVKVMWRFYIPAGLSAAATIACIIGANQIGLRRHAALLGAYSLMDNAFGEYKEKVLGEIGKTKAAKIEDEVNKERLHRSPASSQVVFVGTGEQMCMDALSGRYFKSDAETIRRAEITLNQRILQDMYASLNEFYALVGLPAIEFGEELGFNIDRLVDLHFSTLLNDCDVPTLVVGFRLPPKAGYDKIAG